MHFLKLKAVVAGAAGPASAGPLFWPSMLTAVPFFFDRHLPIFSLMTSLYESRLIDEIIINTQNSCHRDKGVKINSLGIIKRVKTVLSLK